MVNLIMSRKMLSPLPMNLLNTQRFQIGFSVCLLMLFLTGCAVPGMQMGVRASGSENVSGAASSDISQRAQVFAINPTTVASLTSEQEQMEQQKRNTLQAAKSGAVGGYKYQVGAQDVLRITVWNHPELTNPSGTANELSGRIVNSDGKFFFPFVGRVQAAGKTVEEIRDDLSKGLGPYIKNPQVDVSVLQYRSQRVFLSGEIRTPGALQVTDVPPRVTEAIAQAGGLTPEADLSSVTVTRGNTVLTVDLNKLYYQGDLQQNIYLQHDDVVNVPDRRFNKVFVLGEVVRPNSLQMPARGRFTLAEALSDSGGTNPISANSGQIYVIRASANSLKPDIYHLNAASPDALVLADKFNLRPRDVVFVDAAQVVRWARVVNYILPSVDSFREILNDTTRGLPR
jgi:polysaccharide biosynthesis/export protein